MPIGAFPRPKSIKLHGKRERKNAKWLEIQYLLSVEARWLRIDKEQPLDAGLH